MGELEQGVVGWVECGAVWEWGSGVTDIKSVELANVVLQPREQNNKNTFYSHVSGMVSKFCRLMFRRSGHHSKYLKPLNDSNKKNMTFCLLITVSFLPSTDKKHLQTLLKSQGIWQYFQQLIYTS